MLDKVQQTKSWKFCKVPVCDKIAWAKGYCSPHYQKHRVYGYVPNTPVAVFAPKGQKPPCSVPDCTRTAHAKSLCHTHYTQELRKLKKSLGYSR